MLFFRNVSSEVSCVGWCSLNVSLKRPNQIPAIARPGDATLFLVFVWGFVRGQHEVGLPVEHGRNDGRRISTRTGARRTVSLLASSCTFQHAIFFAVMRKFFVWPCRVFPRAFRLLSVLKSTKSACELNPTWAFVMWASRHVGFSSWASRHVGFSCGLVVYFRVLSACYRCDISLTR